MNRRSSRFGAAFLAVLLLGLILRVYHLNAESISYDESFSMNTCRMPTAEMMGVLIADFVHPPLHYFTLCGWMDVAGFGTMQARLLSLIFGTLSIVVLYLLADYLFDRRTALLSALLLAVSQLQIMLSQDARMYEQVLLLFLCCTYLFIRALHERSLRLWCAFVAVGVVLLYTHYFGVLVLGSLVLFALVYHRRYPLPVTWWIGGVAAVVLAYLPWLTSGVVSAATHSPKTFSGANSWWSVNVTTFFSTVNYFNNGKAAGLLTSSPIWSYPAGALLFTVPAIYAFFVSREKQERENFWLSAMLWLLPVLGAIVGGLMQLQYNHRYVAFSAAPYYVLVGRGIAGIRRDAIRIGLVIILLAYSANSLRINYFNQRLEDFRGAAAYVRPRTEAGDCAVFLPRFTVPLQWTIEEPNANLLRVLSADDFAERRNTCARIWAISWSFYGNSAQVANSRTLLQQLDTSHALVEQKKLTWVDVALYARKQSE